MADDAGVSAASAGVSGGFGTSGAGARASIPVFRALNARSRGNRPSGNMNGSTPDADYKLFKLKRNTFDALAGWRPWDNGFRTSSVLLRNGNKANARARVRNGLYRINGNTYDAALADDLKDNADFNEDESSFSIGLGDTLRSKGWSFSGNFGVLLQSSSSVSFRNWNCSAGRFICDQWVQDVAEEKGSLKDKVRDYQYNSIIRIGADYRF